MNTQDKIRHNQTVVRNAIQTLFDFHIVNPLKYTSNPEYGRDLVFGFIEAANIARTQLMGMKPIYLYRIEEEE